MNHDLLIRSCKYMFSIKINLPQFKLHIPLLVLCFTLFAFGATTLQEDEGKKRLVVVVVAVKIVFDERKLILCNIKEESL